MRYYGQWMRDEAERRIGHLYPKVQVIRDRDGSYRHATPEERQDPESRIQNPKSKIQHLTVIAWLWARTVRSPNPAFAHLEVPLASTFMLSTRAGKEAWVEPVIEGDGYRFTVKTRASHGPPPPEAKLGTTAGKRAAFRCLMSNVPISYDHIRSEGQAGRMGARLMAIVAEGERGRVYLPPTPEHEAIARSAQPEWKPEMLLPNNPRDFKTPNYGLTTFGDLFTPRQLVALNTFAELVMEARERVWRDALSSPPVPPSPAELEESSPPLPPSPAKLERGEQAARAPLSTVGGEGGWGGEDLTAPLSSPPLPPAPAELEESSPPLPPSPAKLERGEQAARAPLSPAGGEAARAPLSTVGGEGGRGGEDLPPPAHNQRYGPIVCNPAINPVKAQLARELRQRATAAEAAVWELLRDRRCLGLKFRRQQVIRGFIVDFYCPELRLALEIDGPVHEQQLEADAERTRALAEEGIRVVRLRNDDVTAERLTAMIKAVMSSPPVPPSPAELEESSPPLPPSPAKLERGEQAARTPLSPAGGEAAHAPLSTAGGAGGWGGEEPLAAGGTGPRAYADAVAVYLGLAVSKLADAQSSLCRWKTTMDQSIATFGRQALPMVWDYSEANIFGEMAGDFIVSLRNMMRVVEQLPTNTNGRVLQADAQSQHLSTNKLISTDPPYYDNIGYADLSDFFYVWLRRCLRPVFPDLFATLAVPKAEELVATPYRHGGKERAERFFLDGMTRAMQRLAEQAHPAFPVTIYYAFKQAETSRGDGAASTGWETFLDAVIRAGFAISGTWPIRTEMRTRQVAMDTNALASSIVLVCRRRAPDAPTATRRDFVAALKAELPAALRAMQRGNIAPVDLAQAAIGPGMAVFTRFGRVIDAAGKPLAVREALALINATLDEVLAEQEGDFDADTRWALAWFEQYGFGEGEYGVAETLSKAKNTSVGGMVEAGLLVSRGGRVRLLRPEELPADWDPASDGRLTVWEMTHHLARALGQGEQQAAALLARLGPRAEVARELAYRLYTLCERKKRAAEALEYNALVQSWPEMARLAGGDLGFGIWDF